MADSDQSLTARESGNRQPCLDFNSTRLPKYHEAFGNPQVKFSTALKRYVPALKDKNTGQDVAEDSQQLQLLPERSSSATPSSTPRQPFWDEMLSEAMHQLKLKRDEPAGLVGTRHSIRIAAGWPDIVNTLEIARAKYYDYPGFIGFWKKTGHKIADRSTDGKRLLSLLPDSEYTSVIHCVFDAIFDVTIAPFPQSCLVRSEYLTRCRQPREQPKFERKWREPYVKCAKSSQTWNESWRFAPMMMTILFPRL